MVNVVERILNYKGKLLIIQNSSTTLLFKLMTISDIPNDDSSEPINTIAGKGQIGSTYIDTTTGASYIATVIGTHSLISTLPSPTFITSTVSFGGPDESKKQPDNTGAIETLFKLIDDLQTSVCTLQSRISTLESALFAVESKSLPSTTYSAGLLSAADKSKLDTIDYGATNNYDNAYLLDRSNHTGIQAISSIAWLATHIGCKSICE